ncbi:Pantothenate synthetase [BD1-7 clade bacterium]|uniref:Pantothenate synthetase n=1 Tax=BD1-7 clade bacterium TaxID=2029982 RepID=A0A5S9MQF6_9GAMM|nr:Pantothenate synthetase [BD1-7 clade bacterium]CAA0085110.1 Pantothenate synthetase [BD1-7 clade bacterium]
MTVSLKTCTYIAELRDALSQVRQQGKTIGFVPTMGNLHDGHLSLVKEAQKHVDVVVVSIFVNPLQFGANEDLDSYPRTLAADKDKLIAQHTDFLFTPVVEEIYPHGMETHTKVVVPELGSHHCGSSRPGHFDGVSTVVTKLLNIVGADIAVFGQKDFQQLAIIRKMADDLCLPTRIHGAPTHRADDGLALSSRNQYMNDEQRALAPNLYRIIGESQQQVLEGTAPNDVEQWARGTLNALGLTVDYFNIADARTLEPLSPASSEAVILAASFLGNTRLIDNLTFSTTA